MHPIERLRWIARAEGEPASLLASEAAWTLADLAREEPHALVTACRRLIDSHATAATLWWVSANVLVDPDPEAAARRVVDELCADPTAERLAAAISGIFGDDGIYVVPAPVDALTDGLAQLSGARVRVVGVSPRLRGQVRAVGAVVLEVSGFELDEVDEALDSAAAVLVEVTAASSEAAYVRPEVAKVLTKARDSKVSCWAIVPVGRLLHPQLARGLEQRAGREVARVDWSSFDVAVGPEGVGSPRETVMRATCPVAPELLSRAG